MKKNAYFKDIYSAFGDSFCAIADKIIRSAWKTVLHLHYRDIISSFYNKLHSYDSLYNNLSVTSIQFSVPLEI